MTAQPYADAAEQYASAGWAPLPLGDRPGLKTPPPTGYTGQQGRNPTPDDIAAWTATRGDRNIGVRLPEGVVGIDVDDYAGKAGADTMKATAQRHGRLPRTWVSTSRDGLSGIRWFRAPAGVMPGKLVHPDDEDQSGVEVIQHTHRYAVVPPSIHPEGRRYQWITPDGEHSDTIPLPADLPELPPAWVDHIRKDCSCYVATTYDWSRFQPTNDRKDPVWDTFERWSARLNDSYGRHDAATGGTMALVGFRHRGWPGAQEALDRLEQQFYAALGDSRSRREAEAEWQRMVAGAEAKAASTGIPEYKPPLATVTSLPAPDPEVAYTVHDPRVVEELERMRVREAARKLARQVGTDHDGSLFGSMLDYAAGDLANLPQPVTLLGPYFQAGGVNVIYGRGASYKSFVAQSAAASIATGKPWGHYAVREQLVSVYWAAEGRSGLQKRFWAWEVLNGAKIPPGMLLVPEKWPRLDDPALGEVIADELDSVGCRWLTVDTLNRTKGKLRENDSDDLGSTLFDVLTPSLLRGIGVCIVHHSGWNNDHARGSSALFDNADQVYKVTKDGNTITLHDEKGKDNAERPLLYMQLTESASSVVVTPTEERPLHPVAKDCLDVLMAEGGWMDTRALGDKTGHDRQRINDHLKPLENRLVERQLGVNGKPATWRALVGSTPPLDRPDDRPDGPPQDMVPPW